MPSFTEQLPFCLPRSLDLTGPLLLGGVPDLPESFPVWNRHFVGCMRDFLIDNREVDMADFIANNGTVPGMMNFRAREKGWRKELEFTCVVGLLKVESWGEKCSSGNLI